MMIKISELLDVKNEISLRRGYTLSNPYHPAWDITVPSGTVVRSPGIGVVKSSHKDRLGNSYLSIYFAKTRLLVEFLHLKKVYLVVGNSVSYRDAIGLSGGATTDAGSGSSTGPHLHIQVRKAGKLINPSLIFSI